MKKYFVIGIGGMVVGMAAFGLMRTNDNALVRPITVNVNESREKALVPANEAAIKRMETPRIVRAVYLTAPSGGREDKVRAVIAMKKNGLNAVVIDVKDSFGVVAYDSQLDIVNRYEIKRKFIPDLSALVQRFHDEGIYVIARIAVFQDTALAEVRPEIAVHDKAKLKNAGGVMSKKTLWRDGKNLAWVDPSSKEVWEYVVALSNDALSYGFDELNYDYIRFPSDGKISNITYSVTKSDATYPQQINEFMQYLREQTRGTVISADLFGFTMVKTEDIGIGQIVEDAYAYFDYVSPMVYPSHYPSGFMGYKNPAAWPYEVIFDSMQKGQQRLDTYRITASSTARLRPWLQDFDLGADYDVAMIGRQIKATEDALSEQYTGYMLWNPSSNYTAGGVQ